MRLFRDLPSRVFFVPDPRDRQWRITFYTVRDLDGISKLSFHDVRYIAATAAD